LAEQSFQNAASKGLDDLDMSAVIIPLEEEYEVVIKKKD
jgi:3-hydroxyisobutyrate dehydrogenase